MTTRLIVYVVKSTVSHTEMFIRTVQTMIENIIKQLILTAGQWKQFGEQQYSDQFNTLLNQLRVATGTTPEAALDLLLAEFNREGVAA